MLLRRPVFDYAPACAKDIGAALECEKIANDKHARSSLDGLDAVRFPLSLVRSIEDALDAARQYQTDNNDDSEKFMLILHVITKSRV